MVLTASVLMIVLMILMILGVPIALAMIISSLASLIMASDVPLIVIPQRLWGGLESFPLLAIPTFVFAGILMNKGGGAQRIFDFCLSICGHIRGGLAHVNVLASMIFAGMTGAATADAAGLGPIEIDAMRRDGYTPEFSGAVTAASSVIGPIIPPSVPLVVYGVMAQVSVGKLFLGGLIPGIIMGLSLMGVIAIIAHRKGFPTRPRASFREIVHSFRSSFFALLAPIIVIGGIFSGVFTPTEAGVVAALYALVLGFAYGGIKLRDLPGIIKDAMLNTAQVTFIVGAASLFGWIVTRQQLPAAISSSLFALTGNKYVVLLLINLALLIMGCFIDALALLIMMTPVVVPIALSYNIDLVQLGVIIAIGTVIGLNTPPVGLCLYIVSNAAKVPIMRVARALIPFYAALILALLIVTLFPQLVTFLPNLMQF